MADAEILEYEIRGSVAVVTMQRPRYRNAQNSAMTYALDHAFYKAAENDDVRVVVLAGSGDHFSAGHDIGTPDRDVDQPYPRVASLWWSHVGQVGSASRYAREQEVYLGMCQRWRSIPKPMIAMVQGACIAGGLMLAWVCDLIIASEEAFFADPVVRMGIPGVEFFAHPWMLGSRAAREFLYLGERMSAQRAYELGMVNHVVARADLEETTFAIAGRIATMPRFGLALTKKAINEAEDLMGMRTGIEMAFSLHHLAHAHNAETQGDQLGGQSIDSMRKHGRSGEVADPKGAIP
jgi:enoyl-CoA hydratase